MIGFLVKTRLEFFARGYGGNAALSLSKEARKKVEVQTWS